MGKWMLGGCMLALGLGCSAAEAAHALKCADSQEVTAMQAAAVQQELMDAALTCGGGARDNYNAFQTSFGPELRRSDHTLLVMFHRIMGYRQGDDAYNLFKTNLASRAELRRVHGVSDFCAEANVVVAAALSPDKPSLSDFVAGVAVTDMPSPVNTCSMQVTVSLQGALAGVAVVPTPNPMRMASYGAVRVQPPQPVVTNPVQFLPVRPPAGQTPPAATPPTPAKDTADKKDDKGKSSGWLSDVWN